jgi:hypothetical protein
VEQTRVKQMQSNATNANANRQVCILLTCRPQIDIRIFLNIRVAIPLMARIRESSEFLARIIRPVAIK